MTRRVLLVAVFSALVVAPLGCRALREMGNTAPPGIVVAIAPFKCNGDPLIGESVQDCFVDVFFRSTSAKPVKGENGEIVIVGVVTMSMGGTGNSEASMGGYAGGGFAGVGGSASGTSASGNYASGITVQATRNGELIATYSAGQDLRDGVLLSPVALATKAAIQVSTVLVRQNQIGRP